jgi:serine protease Do
MAIQFAGGETKRIVPQPVPLPDAIVQAKAKLGLTVELMTPMLADKYQMNQEDGIFVDAVAAGSVADKAGVKGGDIIVQLGRFRVTTLDDLSVLLNRLPETGDVRVGVIRDDELGFGTLEFGPAGSEE